MALFKATEIRGSTDGPHLLMTAGVHGDEYEGIEAIRQVLSDVTPDKLRGRLTAIPVVNESAYAHSSRTGEDGLDLARTFPGLPNGRLTERVAHDLSLLIQEADFYIDLHSGGKAILVDPLVGYMLVEDERVLDLQRAMARAFGLDTVWGTSATLDGRSLSVARDFGVPAIYAEYLGGGECSPDGVAAYVAGCLGVLKWCGMIPGDVPATSPTRVVEDYRPLSGYLQIRNPSPIRGVFTPSVDLGQTVARGDVIGRVTGDAVVGGIEVPADTGGRVICLRFDRSVEAADSLAVILEMETEGF